MGDSGQGFINGLLFVLFTGEVRARFFSWKICTPCYGSRRRGDMPVCCVDGGETAPLIPSRSRQGLTNEWGDSITPTESVDAECSTWKSSIRVTAWIWSCQPPIPSPSQVSLWFTNFLAIFSHFESVTYRYESMLWTFTRYQKIIDHSSLDKSTHHSSI